MERYALSPVRRSTLTEEIVKTLYDSITNGSLPPGTRLVELDLAAKLGVSRGPLREALRILESEGVVMSIPGYGSYVKKFSQEDIAEVYSLRTLLEQEAVRLAAVRATNSQINNVEKAYQAMLEAAKEGDIPKVIDRDMEFHIKLWEASNHKLLAQVLSSIISQIKVFLALQTSLYEDLAAGVEDHEAIIDCIKNHRGEEGAELMEKHLNNASKVVMEFVQNQENLNS